MTKLRNLLQGIEDYIVSFDIRPEDWELIEIDCQEVSVYSLHCKGEAIGEFTEKYIGEAIRDLLIDRTYRTRQWSTVNLAKASNATVEFLKENPTFLTDFIKESK